MGKMVEKAGRCLKTVFFMVAMLVSLLVSSLPVLVSIVDVFVPTFLLSSFTCLTCYTFNDHLTRYSFKTSLTDIPLVSLLRSFLVICVYSLSDGPALSHGPYLGTVSLCSLVSIVLLSVKACIFTANSQLNAESSISISPSRQRLHLKKSWGMPVLFLSSVVFALGHTVVAYRTSCRARRKLLFHSRVDPEAVLSCKGVFSSYQKIPRSPIPLVRKVSKTDGEVRRKLLPSSTSHDGGELPVRVLADLDSLFVTVTGLSVHYKICTPGSPSTYSSTLPPEANSMLNVPEAMAGRLKLDRKLLSINKLNHHHHKSCSSLFSSSLHDPLLEASPTSPLLLKDTLEEADDMMNASSCEQQDPSDGSRQFGVVLVHGFGGGVFSWRNLMASLAHQLGCVVTAFDRPGWGLTARPHLKDLEERDLPNPYTLENQVDMLVAFCHEMAFASVVLVGHDDGGLIALKAAQRLVSASNVATTTIKVKGVVLLNASLTREVVPAFARILLHTSLGKKHLVRPLLRTEIAQVVNRRAWYDPSKMTTDVLKLYKAPLHVEGWDEALHEIGRLSSEMVLSTQNALSLLKAVESLPVLVVAGAEDALVPLKSSQVMASKLFNSRLVAISGCGHLPHEECPKALLAAMTPFISRLVPSD